MKVEIVNVWGDDLSVVNSARVSLGKHKDAVDESDIKLIKYLAKNGHVSTMEHAGFTFRVDIPIFIARQFMRHKSWSFNEISGRYVEFKDSYFTPDSFRLQSKDIKQGSLDDTENKLDQDAVKAVYQDAINIIFQQYRNLLSMGVAKEQARGLLPLALNTQLYATCNFRSFIHFLQSRLDPHAQKEIQDMAKEMLRLVKEYGRFKYSLEAFGY